MSNIVRTFFSELVRRRVLRTLGAYVVIVWLLAQGLVDLLPALGAPDWAFHAFVVLAIAAAPLIAIVAWRYDLTRHGFLRYHLDVDPGSRNAFRGGGRGAQGGPAPRHDGGTSTVIATWTDGQGEQQRCEFYADFIVGRDFQADIRLSDECVSRRHLKVTPQVNDWFVEDMGSLIMINKKQCIMSYVKVRNIDFQRTHFDAN